MRQGAARSGLDRLAWMVGEATPVILLGVVLVLVMAEIIARNFFLVSLAALGEVVILAFVWLVWLGALGAARQGELMGVRYFVQKLGRHARIVDGITDLVTVAICCGVMRAAWLQITTSQFASFDMLGLPRWVLSLGLLVGIAALAVFYLLRGLSRLVRPGAPP